MLEFLQVTLSFPTVIYSVLLGAVVCYWLLSALGLIGMDVVDGWFGGDAHGHFGGDGHAHGGGLGDGAHVLGDGSHAHAQGSHPPSSQPHSHGVTDPLMRLGLGGIPVTVVLTALVFTAWALCYLTDLWLLRQLPPGLMRTGGGIATMVLAFVVAIPVAAFALRPVRKLLRKMQPLPPAPILGQTAVIRSPSVTTVTGTASVEDGGAGLILQIRDDNPERFKRGDRVVLIEYIEGQNAYRVVSEEEFRGV